MFDVATCPPGNSNNLTAAIIAASVTVLVGYLTTFASEQYKRHRDRTTLAAALAGELASYKMGQTLLIKTLDAQLEMLEAGQRLTGGKFDKPVDVVFDANVEKLGLLGTEMVEAVVFVYNQIRAFRATFAPLLNDPTISNAHAIGIVKVCKILVTNALEHGEALIGNLKQISRERWLLPMPKNDG